MLSDDSLLEWPTTCPFFRLCCHSAQHHTPLTELPDLCCKNIDITRLTQLLQWPTTFVLKPVQCHLGCYLDVIFTAFFVPWLDGWQAHSGWIVKWPPKKALNSLRLPATSPFKALSTHLISWLWSWYRGNMQQFPLLFASKLSFPRKMIIRARSPHSLGQIWHRQQSTGTNLKLFCSNIYF